MKVKCTFVYSYCNIKFVIISSEVVTVKKEEAENEVEAVDSKETEESPKAEDDKPKEEATTEE